MNSELRTKVFIDTNVLIDVLVGTRPSSTVAKVIFQEVRNGHLEGVITTQSIVDASYITRNEAFSSDESFYRQILNVSNYFNIEKVDYFDIRSACLHPSGDFEDDVQFARAKDGCCDFFITNDRHFLQRHSSPGIKILTPEAFVVLMQSE